MRAGQLSIKSSCSRKGIATLRASKVLGRILTYLAQGENLIVSVKMPMNTNSESGVDSVDSNQNMSKKEHSAINNSTTSSGSSESNNKPRRLLTSFSIFRKDKKFSNSSSNNTESKKIVITTRNDTVAKSVPHNLVLDNSRLEVGVDCGWPVNLSWNLENHTLLCREFQIKRCFNT